MPVTIKNIKSVEGPMRESKNRVITKAGRRRRRRKAGWQILLSVDHVGY